MSRRRVTDTLTRKVAEHARHHGVRPAARKYGIYPRNIGRWLEIRLDKVKERGRGGRSEINLAKGESSHTPDEQLVQWVLELRDL